MPRVLNCRIDGRPSDAVYVGRPSKWGNPFVALTDNERDLAVDSYEKWFLSSHLFSQIDELRGKDLVCWCAPKRCHAEILLKYANKEA